MKAPLSLALFALLCAFTATAQPTSSLLWRVEGPDLVAPSYLFGTVHLLCKDDLVLGEGMVKAFEEVDKLVLELDMDDPGMFLSMQQSMTMAGDSLLSDLLDSARYAWLNQYFLDSVGMGLEAIGRFKPFMVQTFLYPSLMGCKPVSYEESLVRWAKKRSLPVEGLESVNDQMQIFDEIPYATQAEWLWEVANNPEEARQQFVELAGRYRTGDHQQLYDWMIASLDEYSEYRSLLLDDRNAAWVAQMEVMMQEGAIFFAVGAAHLGGEKGLLGILTKMGYQVTPVAVGL